MDIRQLRYLVKIVEHQSFTSAAESLHIASSALGVQIRNLEDELGVPLLLRHARGVSQTAAGEVLVEHAKGILAALENAANAARGASLAAQVNGHVSIGLTPPICDFASVPLLEALKLRHPDLSAAVVEAPGLSLGSLARLRELDLACLYDFKPHEDIVAEQLLEDEFVFFETEQATGAAGPVSFATAIRAPLVLPAAPHGSRQVIEKTAQRRRLRLDVRYEVQSLAAVRELVLSGHAAAIVPFASVVRHVGDGRTRIRPLVEPRIVRPLWLVRQRSSTVARAHVEAAASVLADVILKKIADARQLLSDSFGLNLS